MTMASGTLLVTVAASSVHREKVAPFFRNQAQHWHSKPTRAYTEIDCFPSNNSVTLLFGVIGLGMSAVRSSYVCNKHGSQLRTRYVHVILENKGFINA